MAYITVNRAIPLLVNGLKQELKNVALYRESANITVGQALNKETTVGKSDDSPFFVEVNITADTTKYKTQNNFADITYTGGNFGGLNKITNFFAKADGHADKLVFWNGSQNIVKAVIPITQLTNTKDTSVFVETIEINVV